MSAYVGSSKNLKDLKVQGGDQVERLVDMSGTIGLGILLDPTPYTLNPSPYTLHPTSHTLHPTPYTLSPTPYTG